jgi:hypothetical protein
MRRASGANAQNFDLLIQPRSAHGAGRSRYAAFVVGPLLGALAAVGCGDQGGKGPGENVPAESEGETATAEQAIVAPTCVTVQRGTFGTVADAHVARTITKPSAIDADANTNYGAAVTASMGTIGPKLLRKTLVWWDLSFIPPSAVVNSATVTVRTTAAQGPATVEVRRVTEFWDEGRITYNNWKNGQEAIVPPVSFVSYPPAAVGFRSFDIPSLAQGWVSGALANYGLVLLQEGNFATTIATSEAAVVANRPKLVICYTQADSDGDGFAAPADCDDNDPSIHPGAAESCNGLDDNCNGSIDEGDPGGGAGCGTGQPGVCGAGTKHCLAGGLVCTSNVQPSAETCDGLDNDCNGAIDDNAPGAPVWHHDVDGDGFGSATDTHASCVQPAGYVADGSDCNDADGDIHPGAAELCNGVDDNCSGAADEGNPGSGMACATGQVGACATGTTACSGGGLVCNQNQQASAETCDGIDNNCNGAVDDGASDADTWYRDADNDGHGDASVVVKACAQPLGYVILGDDCNDADPTIYPGVNGSCGGHAATATLSGGVSAHSPAYSGVFSLGQSPGGAANASSPSYRFHGGLVGATQGK